MSKSVLVVVAHADDEVLGCGGTIARHVAEGDVVHVVYMADGVGARGGNLQGQITQRNHARDHALDALGVAGWFSLGFPDNCMDSVPLLDIVQTLEPIVARVLPTTIYTHHYGDLNIDHRVTHQAVMTSCRPMPECIVHEIYTFEVMSSTEWASPSLAPFIPNFFVDIASYVNVKKEALTAYGLEMRPAPHSRSISHIENLAMHRGHSVGRELAEAFMLMRSIR